MHGLISSKVARMVTTCKDLFDPKSSFTLDHFIKVHVPWTSKFLILKNSPKEFGVASEQPITPKLYGEKRPITVRIISL